MCRREPCAHMPAQSVPGERPAVIFQCMLALFRLDQPSRDMVSDEQASGETCIPWWGTALTRTTTTLPRS